MNAVVNLAYEIELEIVDSERACLARVVQAARGFLIACADANPHVGGLLHLKVDEHVLQRIIVRCGTVRSKGIVLASSQHALGIVSLFSEILNVLVDEHSQRAQTARLAAQPTGQTIASGRQVFDDLIELEVAGHRLAPEPAGVVAVLV